MLLPRNYRFSVQNQTNVVVGVVISIRRFRLDGDGGLTWDIPTEVFNTASISVSSANWTNGSAQDNSTDKWHGADVFVTVTPSASSTGAIGLQLQVSNDGGVTWNTDGYGIPLMGRYLNAVTATFTYAQRIE